MGRGVEEAEAWEDERSLVARCREGDEHAWSALYETYAPRVARTDGTFVGLVHAG